jgi:hypothetical protein
MCCDGTIYQNVSGRPRQLTAVIARGSRACLEATASIGVQYSDTWILSIEKQSTACGGQKSPSPFGAASPAPPHRRARDLPSITYHALLFPAPLFCCRAHRRGRILDFYGKTSCLVAQGTGSPRRSRPCGTGRCHRWPAAVCLPGGMGFSSEGLLPTYGPATAAELPMKCTASSRPKYCTWHWSWYITGMKGA